MLKGYFIVALAVVDLAACTGAEQDAAKTWRGLSVEPERRCSPYDRSDYRYPQSVERHIALQLGGWWSPYDLIRFNSLKESDIEHIVSLSEAHDSGMCSRNRATREQFAADMLNLTLARPALNRWQKHAKDAADWLPEYNRCWFAWRVIMVRQKYGLTIDRREAAALERVLAECEFGQRGLTQFPANFPREANRVGLRERRSELGDDALRQYDDNGNGRITCAEARRHGIAPARYGHPAYPYMSDGDGDGVVCD